MRTDEQHLRPRVGLYSNDLGARLVLKTARPALALRRSRLLAGHRPPLTACAIARSGSPKRTHPARKPDPQAKCIVAKTAGSASASPGRPRAATRTLVTSTAAT